MKDVAILLSVFEDALLGYNNSKIGLETYTESCDADHGDGQQVGREDAYHKVMLSCAEKLVEVLK